MLTFVIRNLEYTMRSGIPGESISGLSCSCDVPFKSSFGIYMRGNTFPVLYSVLGYTVIAQCILVE